MADAKQSEAASAKRPFMRSGSCVTFCNQETLPKLPIPTLQATLAKYVDTVAPLLSEDELAATEAKVNDFAASEGPVLQELLQEFAKDKSSYVEEFWDAAYLEFDAPVPINVNPVFVLEDDPTPTRTKIVPRAVSLVFSTLKFIRSLRNETLAPDTARPGGPALCMEQYTRLFGSARVPDPSGRAADVCVNFPLSTHCLVLCRGQFFYFDCMHEDGELAVTERELNKIISLIVTDAERAPVGEVAQRVGVLTSESRGKWRRWRGQLRDLSHNNSRVLDIIDSALFVVCLDIDFTPDSVTAAAANLLHGTYRLDAGGDTQLGTLGNRWYDKLQVIVAQGGTAGINFEHSAVDGHTVLRYASDAFTDMILRFGQSISGAQVSSVLSDARHGPPPSQRPRLDCTPRKLDWDLSPELRSAIRFAESRLADSILQHEVKTLEYSDYGKNFLTSNGLSPDATVQLAMQAAFYELYGSPANVYESVLTKAYTHGRTEAGRSCTPAAVEWMKAYYARAPPAELADKLRTAAKAHSKMTLEAAKGLGVDRHLYALQCLAKKLGRPGHSIFADEGWRRLNESILSTSNCGNPSLRFFGFGPVCPDGFGLGYIIKEDVVHFMVSSKRRQTERYTLEIARALSMIHDTLLAVAPVQASQRVVVRVFRGAPLQGIEDNDDGSDAYDFFGVQAVERAATPIGRKLGQ